METTSLDDPASVVRGCFDELGPKQRKAAQFILDNEAAAAFLTANELSERVGLDSATVVRLAQRLGYRGYPHLQEAIRRRLPHYPTFLDKVERAPLDATAGSLLERSYLQDRRNIERAVESTNPDSFERLIDGLLTAPRTLVIAHGVAVPVALYLHSSLRMMSFDCVRVTGDATALGQEIAHLSAEDLVLAVGFYRYFRATVSALEAVRRRGAKRVVLTDSPLSPLVGLADIAFWVPVESSSHRTSIVAPMAFANAVLAALAARARKRVTAALRRVNEEYQAADLLVYD